ncbi:MAG TPA: serine hydrolase, partial [Chloroflexota bacterium]|nr:serine hydrolase [Chloroflexota bacterium]
DHLGGDDSLLFRVTGGNRFWVSAAEAFVFISGLLVGIVYGRIALRDGTRAAILKSLNRAWRLYLLTICLTLAFAITLHELGLSWIQDTTGLSPFRFVVGIITMRRAYEMTDVLLFYTLVVSLGGFAAAQLAAGRTWQLLLLSVGLWAGWQQAPGRVELPWPIADNSVFHFPAWQLVFVGGLVVGYHREVVTRTLSRVPGVATLLLSGTVVTAAALLHGSHWQQILQALPGTDPDALETLLFEKADLHAGRLFLFAWLALFAFTIVTLAWRPIRLGLGWLLLPLGQHPLLAYTAHLFVLAADWRCQDQIFGTDWPSTGQTTVLGLASVLAVWLAVRLSCAIAGAASNWFANLRSALAWSIPSACAGRAARRAIPRACVVALLALAPARSVAVEPLEFQDAVQPTVDATLTAAVQSRLPEEDGEFGIAIEDLKSGRSTFINAQQRFPSASLYKLAVLYEFYRQKQAGLINVDEVLTVTDDDLEATGVNTVGGPAAHVCAGVAAQLMIVVSDNVAANVLARRLGRANINQTLNALGLKSTRLYTEGMSDPGPIDGLSYTSANDTLTLLRLIAAGKAVDADSSREMLNMLLASEINDRLPAGLPFGTPIAHKTGDLDGILNDAGIVYGPRSVYIVAVLSQNVGDREGGRAAIQGVSSAVFSYLETPVPQQG